MPTNARELFLVELDSVYVIEQQLKWMQETAVDQATNGSLAASINQHMGETNQHITNLDRINELLSRSREEDGEAMVTVQGEDMMPVVQLSANPPTTDLAVANALYKMEAFEVACYTSLLANARNAGIPNEVVSLLAENLGQDEMARDRAQQITPDLVRAAINVGNEDTQLQTVAQREAEARQNDGDDVNRAASDLPVVESDERAEDPADRQG